MRTSLATRLVCLALILLAGAPAARAQNPGGNEAVIWVTLNSDTKLGKIAPGAVLEGQLERSLYWRDAEIFPPGSTVRMVVERITQRKKAHPADDRPFVIHAFAPRHEPVGQFRSVSVVAPGGREVALWATFTAFSQRAELSAEAKKHADKTGGPALASAKKAALPWVLTLQVEPEGTTFAALAETLTGKSASSSAACADPCAIANGTQIRLAILQGVSASQDRQGHAVTAVVLEPVRVGSAIAIPQGSILQGVLAKSVPPRRLYRPGSLNLVFTRLALPNGFATAIAASPVSAEVERGTHMTMDAEGGIHGGSPGRARFLVDFGVTGGISKVSDDTTQLIIEAISSTATDTSTAGVARFAAMGTDALYMLTRHGRDVILPPYTEMSVVLNRAVDMPNRPSSVESPK